MLGTSCPVLERSILFEIIFGRDLWFGFISISYWDAICYWPRLREPILAKISQPYQLIQWQYIFWKAQIRLDLWMIEWTGLVSSEEKQNDTDRDQRDWVSQVLLIGVYASLRHHIFLPTSASSATSLINWQAFCTSWLAPATVLWQRHFKPPTS